MIKMKIKKNIEKMKKNANNEYKIEDKEMDYGNKYKNEAEEVKDNLKKEELNNLFKNFNIYKRWRFTRKK